MNDKLYYFEGAAEGGKRIEILLDMYEVMSIKVSGEQDESLVSYPITCSCDWMGHARTHALEGYYMPVNINDNKISYLGEEYDIVDEYRCDGIDDPIFIN